jgi:hypothetical protein
MTEQNEALAVVKSDSPPADQPIEIHNQSPAPVQIRNAFDLAPGQFKAGLKRQGENRTALMTWIKGEMHEGVDYGKIHVVKRDKCNKGKFCDNPHHFSKDSLFKPGAEKIVGMMGFRAIWPTLVQYENAAIEGKQINQVALRCQLVDKSGNIISEGWGARNLAQDSNDLNKSVKMAKKSGLIDAVLNAGGLSEVFTQDVEDMPKDSFGDEPPFDPYNQEQVRFDGTERIDPAKAFPFGKHKGQPWADVPLDYLEWCLDKMSNLDPGLRKQIEQAAADKFVAPEVTQGSFEAKIEERFEEVTEDQLKDERITRAESRPLQYYADLIARAAGQLELENVKQDIAGSIHEKPLKAFLAERLNSFLNWEPAGEENVD